MPMYQFTCSGCNETYNQYADEPPKEFKCAVCDRPARRQYGFNSPKPFQPHYNWSTGQYVKSRSDFREQLKKSSEEQTKRTGVEHNYVPYDPNDK